MHDRESLQALFDFTEADLTVNRAGRLSARQRDDYQRQALNASIEKAAATVALPVIVLLSLAFITFSLRNGDALGAWMLVAIGVWFALMAALFQLAFRLARAALRRRVTGLTHPLLRRLRGVDPAVVAALERGAVERLAGTLTFASDGEHEFVMLDDHALCINVAAEADERLWQLTPGLRYAVYRVPGVEWITSVEVG